MLKGENYTVGGLLDVLKKSGSPDARRNAAGALSEMILIGCMCSVEDRKAIRHIVDNDSDPVVSVKLSLALPRFVERDMGLFIEGVIVPPNSIDYECLTREIKRLHEFARAFGVPRFVEGYEFRSLEPAEEGGQASIYHAVRRQDGVEVAIKLYQTLDGGRAAGADKCKRENNVLSFLQKGGGGEYVPRVYDIVDGKDAGCCIVMDYYPDGSLVDVIQSLDFRTRVDVGVQVCDALRFIHGRGVLHRDVKPENILVKKDGGRFRVVLADFGHAKLPEGMQVEGDGSGREQKPAGTRSFGAPEVVLGALGRACEKSDIYSLGKVIYWLLSAGQIPPEGPGAVWPPLGPEVGQAFVDFLQSSCCCEDVDARPGLDVVRTALARCVGQTMEGE